MRRSNHSALASSSSSTWSYDNTASSNTQARPHLRPQEHFLTISTNGTILSATETILGLPPDAMLMQSMYDLVHEEDVLGLQAIKRYFWDRGQPSVEAYIRRQTVAVDNSRGNNDNSNSDDEEVHWVWLAVRVAAYVDIPIPGAVLHERVALDTKTAMLVSKTSRIVALIAAAVEQAAITTSGPSHTSATTAAAAAATATATPISGAYNLPADVSSLMGPSNGLAIMNYFLNNNTNTNNSNYTDIARFMAKADEVSTESTSANAIKSSNSLANLVKKPSLLEMVRSRTTLDLSRMPLVIADLKMFAYVFTSRISIDDLCHVVLAAFNSPYPLDLSAAITAHVFCRSSSNTNSNCNSNKNNNNNITNNNYDDTPTPTATTTATATTATPTTSSRPFPPQRSQSVRSKTTTTPSSSECCLSVLFQKSHASSSSLESDTQNATHTKTPRRFSRIHRKRSIDVSETTDINTCAANPRTTTPTSSPLSYTTMPQIGTLNLSFTGIGCHGVEFLSEFLLSENPFIKTLDLSFCLVEDRGILSLSKALNRRKAAGLPQIEGLFISGNFLTYKSCKELGVALSTSKHQHSHSTNLSSSLQHHQQQLSSSFIQKPLTTTSTSSSHRSLTTPPATSTTPTATRINGYEIDADEMWDDGDDWDEENNESSTTTANNNGKDSSWRRANNTRETKRPIHQDLVCSANNTTKPTTPTTPATPTTTINNNNIINSNTTSATLSKNNGLLLLHVACASLTPESLCQLLLGLGQDCPIRELCIASNNLGTNGASQLMEFLEGKDIFKYKKGQPVMPFLDRLDISNNNLGNDGTAKITRAISKRQSKVNLVELRLSSNEIGHLGVETLMNKILQQNINNLYLDNNEIGDRGCQLVAASLPCMHHLIKLSLSFNQIGSRGINALMRSLVGCESLEYLALSGNIIKISGSSAMGFALSQHPRLCSLELENCCLSQAAQCHITAGVISNRWVPMKSLIGFLAGPPMVAIGALDVVAQQLSNDECFRIRRDMQMKVIVDWMETNKNNGSNSQSAMMDEAARIRNSLQLSQSAYHRMLDWLGRIPFDEDELSDLRGYFYDVDGGDNERTSDGNINLRVRGDLLAALGSEIVDEIREEPMYLLSPAEGISSSGVYTSESEAESDNGDEERNSSSLWNSLQRCALITSCLLNSNANLEETTTKLESVTDDHPGTMQVDRQQNQNINRSARHHHNSGNVGGDDHSNINNRLVSSGRARKRSASPSIEFDSTTSGGNFRQNRSSFSEDCGSKTSQTIMNCASKGSTCSSIGDEHNLEHKRGKPRIYMFRPFAEKLELLKLHAQEMMDLEPDSYQQDIIAQQFAEASLTLLRQLRYHCMNSGLDGWRQAGKIRRKILIVDDSVVTRKMVSRAFEKANFIVDTASNGEEGVAKLKESIYDIAFMDIDMPVMNGFDATKALREWEDTYRPGARQPICALTAAYVNDFERSELMKFKEAGLDVMESKPCNIPRLFKVVDDVSPMFSDLSITITQTAQTT